jgi:hypothetical protein
LKSLDQKLKKIADGKYTPNQFIIADAKDPDMAGGVGAAGPMDLSKPDGPFRTKQQFYDSVCDIIKDGVVDIMLTSVSTLEAIDARSAYKKSHVTPAIRANDTTDIWRPRHGQLSSEPSRPFRSANIGYLKGLCNLGLYSVTFNNILESDYASVEAYAKFREDAVKHKFEHFLEVFNPNAPQGLSPEQIPAFVNDCILRILAGQSKIEKPLFLKIPFNGRKAMEELAGHDASLIVGILGGSGGTTRDTFELLHQAEKSGAKVALFGRKINLAESPVDLVAMFRPVIERELTPQAAVKEYHARLAKQKIKPVRALDNDQAITESVLEGAR